MFGILVSALSSILGTVFTAVLIKFVVFAALLAVTVGFIADQACFLVFLLF
jgi:hypothetical protein